MAEKKVSLFAARASTGAGTAAKVKVPAGKQEISVVIFGTFVGTVAIEGSLDGTNYAPITSKTAPFAGTVAAFPFMRANVTAFTSGAISADIFADRVFGS